MGAEPPVLPSADEARRWAAEELAKPEYRDAAPSWLGTLWRNFLDWLRSLDGSSTGDAAQVPGVVIAIVVATIIVAAVILARPRLNARVRRPKEVFERDVAVHAADYRARAEAAAASGKWGDAVVERFRALVRSAEDRAILDPQPGLTADEAARVLSLPFGTEARRLELAAAMFDGIRYGNRAAGRADYQAMAHLDASLEAAKPARSPGGKAVPLP